MHHHEKQFLLNCICLAIVFLVRLLGEQVTSEQSDAEPIQTPPKWVRSIGVPSPARGPPSPPTRYGGPHRPRRLAPSTWAATPPLHGQWPPITTSWRESIITSRRAGQMRRGDPASPVIGSRYAELHLSVPARQKRKEKKSCPLIAGTYADCVAQQQRSAVFLITFCPETKWGCAMIDGQGTVPWTLS